MKSNKYYTVRIVLLINTSENISTNKYHSENSSTNKYHSENSSTNKYYTVRIVLLKSIEIS
jgi:hypothetical protein